jgi:hypothetical protein
MRQFGGRVVIAVALATGFASAGFFRVSGQEARNYRAPRMPDGTPDLQGIWQVMNTAEYNLQDHGASLDVPAGRAVVENNELPYRPDVLAQRKKNYETRATSDPASKCFFPGAPRIIYMPFPFQIVQTKDYVEFLHEYGHQTRLVYMNGFPHHKDIPFFMGDARGSWDRDTLVVDSRNFNGETWFDRAGNFHSDALHLTERFTRIDPDHIEYEATVDDPKVFTRPWKMKMPLYRRIEPDAEILEYECYAMKVMEGGLYDSFEKRAVPSPSANPSAPNPGGGRH